MYIRMVLVPLFVPLVLAFPSLPLVLVHQQVPEHRGHLDVPVCLLVRADQVLQPCQWDPEMEYRLFKHDREDNIVTMNLYLLKCTNFLITTVRPGDERS